MTFAGFIQVSEAFHGLLVYNAILLMNGCGICLGESSNDSDDVLVESIVPS